MILPILTHPSPDLRRKALPVDLSRLGSASLLKLITSIEDTFRSQINGVGIAAAQVGILDRIIIVDIPHEGLVTFINPEIIASSKTMFEFEEGCFSVPNTFGIVNRHKSVTVRAIMLNGDLRILKTKGLYSVVFQHEIDHLDGILFIDKMLRQTHGGNVSV